MVSRYILRQFCAKKQAQSQKVVRSSRTKNTGREGICHIIDRRAISELFPQANENAPPSFVTCLLEKLDRKENGITIQDVQGAAAILHVAGTDSVSVILQILYHTWLWLTFMCQTWASLSIFILSMILYPECQAQAQAEIDSVIGSEHLPEFSDRASLPYVECILQETLRYGPEFLPAHHTPNFLFQDGIKQPHLVRLYHTFTVIV
jgi:hypothetical protein